MANGNGNANPMMDPNLLAQGLPVPMQAIPQPMPQEDAKAAKKKKKIVEREEVDLDKDPYEVDLTKEEEEKLTEELCTQLQKEIDDRASFDAKLDLWNGIYNQVRPVKDSPWEGASNVAVPYPGAVVDTTASRCKRSLFAVEDPIIVKPTEMDDHGLAERQERFINKKMIQPEVINLAARKDMEFFACGVDGTSITKNPWVREEETKMEVEHYEDDKTPEGFPIPQSGLQKFLAEFPNAFEEYPKFVKRLQRGQPVDVMVEYQDEVYNGPKPELLDLKNFYASDHRKFNNSKFMMERLELSYDHLKEKEEAGFYHNIDKLIEQTQKDDELENHEIAYENFEVFSGIWKLALKKDKKIRKYLVTVSLEKKLLLRIERYPYNHNRSYFIPSRMIPKKNSDWMGISLIEIVENPTAVMDTMLNQMIDANTMSVAQMFMVRLGGSFNSKIHKVKPGAVWPVRNMDDIKQFIIQNTGPQTQQLFNLIFQFTEQRTGVSVANFGLESPIDPRAPGNKTIALLQEAIIRIEDYINRFRPGIEEEITQDMELYYQYLPDGMSYILSDPETGQISEETISRDVFKFRGKYNIRTQAPDFNKQIYLENLRNAYTTVLTDPMFQAYPESRRLLIKEIFKTMEIPKTNEIVPPLEQIQAFEAQTQAMAMQINEAKQMEALAKEEGTLGPDEALAPLGPEEEGMMQ